jgi:hypothetical protein
VYCGKGKLEVRQVEKREHVLARNGDQEKPSRLRHPKYFAQDPILIGDMFKNLKHGDRVKLCIRERERMPELFDDDPLRGPLQCVAILVDTEVLYVPVFPQLGAERPIVTAEIQNTCVVAQPFEAKRKTGMLHA